MRKFQFRCTFCNCDNTVCKWNPLDKTHRDRISYKSNRRRRNRERNSNIATFSVPSRSCRSRRKENIDRDRCRIHWDTMVNNYCREDNIWTRIGCTVRKSCNPNSHDCKGDRFAYERNDPMDIEWHSDLPSKVKERDTAGIDSEMDPSNWDRIYGTENKKPRCDIRLKFNTGLNWRPRIETQSLLLVLHSEETWATQVFDFNLHPLKQERQAFFGQEAHPKGHLLHVSEKISLWVPEKRIKFNIFLK